MPAFTNSTGIAFADNTTVIQTVAVSGFTSPVTRVSVSFTGLTHTFPADLDFLLVGPDGTHNLLFWSDAGTDLDVTAATFIIADSGAVPLSDAAQLVSGTEYQPADYVGNGVGVETDVQFGSTTGGVNHATTNGAATFASAFNGIDPNGTWTLYARDDANVDTGTLTSWTLGVFAANEVIDGTGNSDTLVVTATGPDSGSYVLNGAATVPFSGITSLTFRGLGDDDVLTIINPNAGLLAVPISYDGGGQAGDALEILAGAARSGSYAATGVSSGEIVHESSERQQVLVAGPDGGFTLTFNGQTTGQLAPNATAAAVQAALNALSTIGGAGGSVAVQGSGGNHQIEFGGSLASTDVPQLIATALGGTTASVNTLTQGARQTIDFTGLAPVTDTVFDVSFTVLGTSGADTITITDGGLVDGSQTWRISSPTFESIRVARKQTLIIDGNGGGDTLSIDTGVVASGLATLHIRGVDTVAQTQALQVSNLRIDAANAVTLDLANEVDSLIASVSIPGGGIVFRNAEKLELGRISTNDGPVTITTDSGEIEITTSAAGAGIDAGNNIVRLQATSDTVFQSPDAAIVAGDLAVRAAGNVGLAVAVNDVGGLAINTAGLISFRDLDGVAVAGVSSSGIFAADVTGLLSGNKLIDLQIGGDLSIARPIDAGTADVRIVAGGSVSQNVSADKILADDLGIIAGGAVTLTAGDNAVNLLAVATTGLVEFRDSTGGLTIGTVATGGGAGFIGVSGITSGNGNVNLRTKGSLAVVDDINAGAGDIRLVSDVGALAAVSGGRLLGDELGIIAPAGVVSVGSSDVNLLAISSSDVVSYRDVDDLVIGSVAAGGNAAFSGATGVAGKSIDISASSPLTIANSISAGAGNVTLTASDSTSSGDDLTINGGITVQAAGNVALRAGDNLNLLAGSSIVAVGFVQGVVDFNSADAGVGATANLNGSITAPGDHTFLGLGDADTFFSAAGPDQFFALAGNDRFVWDPGDGSDTIDGGADTDTLAFNGSVGSEVFALNSSGVNAIFTRNVGGITMTMTAVERVELAAGNGDNLFTVAGLGATGLTGLITYIGGSGVDTIGAAAAVNPFNVAAGAGDDQVATGSGADRLRGEVGNDLLTGGPGDDTAVYAGNVGDYQIEFPAGGDVHIADLRAGAPDGADTLRGIENAEFADATVAFLFGTPNDDNFVAAGNQAIFAGTGADTITFDFRLVDAAVTHAGHSVLIESGSTYTVVSGFDTYVFTDGTVQNDDADVLVDDLFYYARNHDVWTANADADQHYHQFGRHELRDPNALFDTSLYLDINPDVKAANVDPLIHFDLSGGKEGRIPSLGFDPRRYLAANPDVAAANADPLAHFLVFGAPEGRLPFAPTEVIAPNGFDYVFYLANNPDVAAADVDPFRHFQTIGWTEGRDPNALFDVNGYLAHYADVAAAHVNPLDHYDVFGWREGRDPAPAFDSTGYLAANPDVAAAQVNPLTHFLQFGIREGRSPFADGIFD